MTGKGRRQIILILFLLIFSMHLAAKENVLNETTKILKNEKLSSQEKKELIQKYFSKLKFEDIIFTGEELAKEMGDNWYKDDAYAQIMGMIIYEYSKITELDFNIILNEIKNEERPIAWREFMIRTGLEKIKEKKVSDSLTKEYFYTVMRIVQNNKIDPNVRSFIINVLAECIFEDNNVSEILDTLKKIIENPEENEMVTISGIRNIRNIVKRGFINNSEEKQKIEAFLLETFKNRKKYRENVQVELAEALVFTFNNQKILPQLEEMKNEMKDKILKLKIEELIKNLSAPDSEIDKPEAHIILKENEILNPIKISYKHPQSRTKRK